MTTKQILALGSIAAITLVVAVISPPHPPIARPGLAIEAGVTSTTTSTGINYSNSIRGGPDFPTVSGKSDPPPFENIAPRTPAQQKVHMKIIAPDGTSEFDIDLREGEDLCENIEEAKSEGHIRSLTMDNFYLETFGSRYVREINGYSNNWTVKVNDARPEGCSLYMPKAGDTIIWTFGV